MRQQHFPACPLTYFWSTNIIDGDGINRRISLQNVTWEMKTFQPRQTCYRGDASMNYKGGILALLLIPLSCLKSLWITSVEGLANATVNSDRDTGWSLLRSKCCLYTTQEHCNLYFLRLWFGLISQLNTHALNLLESLSIPNTIAVRLIPPIQLPSDLFNSNSLIINQYWFR